MRAGRIVVLGLTVTLLVSLYWWWLRRLPQVDSLTAFPATEQFTVYSVSGEVVFREAASDSFFVIREGQLLPSEGSIRTLADAHLVLLAPGGKSKVEVTQNSELAFVSSERGVGFHFLSGWIYFALSREKGAEVWTVETKKGALETDNADFIVRDNPQLSVEVYRGKVETRGLAKNLVVERAEQLQVNKKREFSKKKIEPEILTPLPFDRVYHSEEKQYSTRFAWSPISPDLRSEAKQTTKVELLLGTKADALTLARVEAGEKPNEFLAQIPAGQYFWRLRFSNKKLKWESPLQTLFVAVEQPVLLVEPLISLNIGGVKARKGVVFRWQNPSKLERLVLEVATDLSFGESLFRQPVSAAGFQILPLEKSGRYFWRISGFRHDSSEFITSRIGEFLILENEAPFDILSPQAKAQIPSRALKGGHWPVLWSGAGSGQYAIEVKKSDNEVIINESVDGQRWFLPELRAGTYRLKISTESFLPVETEFEVVDVPTLVLKGLDGSQGIIRSDRVSWEAGPESATVYRVRVWPFFPTVEGEVREFIVGQKEWIPDLSKEGLSRVLIQALDENSKLVAESESVLFKPTQR